MDITCTVSGTTQCVTKARCFNFSYLCSNTMLEKMFDHLASVLGSFSTLCAR